jgi:uncharacterized membrane-anchored protein
MKLLRSSAVLGGLALVLVIANADILAKRQIVADGRLVLLEIRPVDPRSLLQGDYMALRYAQETMPEEGSLPALPRRGTVIVALDSDGVARFVRFDDGTPLAAAEQRLRFKRRGEGGELQYGAEAFFFQEGDAAIYADARYGMLRVAADGSSVLVGLADAGRNMLKAGDGAAISSP